jgi:capsular exopolysaccharide synthesis family protein
MAISIILASASAYLYWKDQPPVYEARVAMIVGNSAQSINPNAQQLGIERTLATFYAEMTKRQPITQAVIQRLGLNMKPEELSNAIYTNVIGDAQILEIYVYDTDPRRAALLATAFAEELIAQSPSSRLQQSGQEEFVQAQIEDLQVKMAAVDDQLHALRDELPLLVSASDLAEAQAKIAELENVKTGYSDTYGKYLEILSAQDVNSLSIIEPATIPTTSVSTGLIVTMLIAVAGGLVLSIGAILVLEFSDDVFRWGDTPFALSHPVLGVIPRWNQNANPLILPAQPNSQEADALRGLRVRLSFNDEGMPLRKIAISSPAPKDGKTFTSLNLAAAAAASGLKTILVDGDLRRGNLHLYLNCPSEPGLSDLLRRRHARTRSGSDQVIHQTPIENLYLLPIGSQMLDPASLLTAGKLDALFDALLIDADLVVIDTPPAGVGPDASLLAAACDAVALVVSVDQTRRRATHKAIATLERYNLIGLILNRVRLSRSFNVYYHHDAESEAQGLFGRIKRLPSKLFRRVRSVFARRPQITPIPQPAQPEVDGSEVELSFDNVERNGIQKMAARLWDTAEAAEDEGTIILTTEEAAQRLNSTEEIVRGWCAAGRLPAIRIGKQWLVTGLTLQEAAPTEKIEEYTSQE